MELQSPQIAEHRDMPRPGRDRSSSARDPAVAGGTDRRVHVHRAAASAVWPRNLALALAVADPGRRRLGKHPSAANRRRERRAAPAARCAARPAVRRARGASRNSTGAGRSTPERYASRRDELVAALERVYAEMDDEAAA